MATSTVANLTAIIVLLITAAATASDAPPGTGYTNYTVGGASGWFFNATTNTSATNYSTWAATLTFNLGDFLIFNTDTNTTVIQTYNDTTYLSCTTDDAQDNDTSQYYGGSTQFGENMTIAVPLTFEGLNYYFSEADDGIQCQHGMAFEIQVHHGLGLPPSLNQPPPPPYIEPPGPDSTQSPPLTVPQSPSNGAVRAGANVCGVYCVLLHLFPFLLFSNIFLG